MTEIRLLVKDTKYEVSPGTQKYKVSRECGQRGFIFTAYLKNKGLMGLHVLADRTLNSISKYPLNTC